MNQIINIIVRQVMGQLINRGVRAGFDKAGRMGQKRENPQSAMSDTPLPEMTQEERRTNRLARQQARQARQSLKATNRISKF